MKVDTLFVGTSDFSVHCLNLLLNNTFFNVKHVLTQPASVQSRGLKTLASPVELFCERKKLSFSYDFPAGRPDLQLAVVCSYGRLLSARFLSYFPKGAVNVHPSLLPLYRGAAPIERALMDGKKETGVSLQLMTTKLDAGDIIGQNIFAISENDTAKHVYARSLFETEKLLNQDLISFLKGQKKALPQKGQITYAKKISKEECAIVWSESSTSIHNKIRALCLGPQAFTQFEGQRIKIYESEVSQDSFSKASPGSLFIKEDGALIVACGQGHLAIKSLQRAGKKQQKIREFLQGFSFSKGACFE